MCRFSYKGNGTFGRFRDLFWWKRQIGLEHFVDMTDIYTCEANATHATNTTPNNGTKR